MKIEIHIYSVLLIVLIFSNQTKADINHYEFVKQQWNEDQGLPIADINGMIQDKAGYIWLASLSGLIRFDGVEFIQFDTSNSNLPSNRFTTIRKSDDALWLSSDEGHLVRFTDGEAKTMEISDGMPNKRVIRVTPKDDYGLAYGTLEGVVLIHNKNIIGFPLNSIGDEVTAIHWPNRDRLWVSTQSWLYQINDPLGAKIIQRWPLEYDVWSIMTFQEQLWLGSIKGVYSFNGNEFERQYSSEINGRAVLLQRMPSGDLLIGSDRLWHVSKDKITEISKFNVNNPRPTLFVKDSKGKSYYQGMNSLLRDGYVLADFESEIADMLVDMDDGVWVATRSHDLYRFKETNLKIIGVNNRLPSSNFYPVFQASDQSIWVGASSYGTYQLSAKGELMKTIKGDDKTRSIAEIDGKIWLLGSTLCILNKIDECDVFDLGFLLQDYPFTLVHEDSKEKVWLAGRYGSMWMREYGHWQKLDDEQNWHVTTRVQTVLETDDGDLWFGTNGDGLIRIRNGSVISDFNQWGLKSKHIRSLLKLDERQLLVGTEDQGLCLIQLKQPAAAKCINNQKKLGSTSVHHMHIDESNRLWWSSNQGIFWQPLDVLITAFDGNLNELPSGGRYDERNGMRNSEANGGVYPAGLVDQNNQVWFPTQEGLAVINLTDYEKIPTAQTIIQSVSSVITSYKADQGSISLDMNERSIQVKLTALSFFDPVHIEFRYRQSNQSAQWVELGQNRLASFNNLSKGSQMIEFSARNKGGNWQAVPTNLTIDITPFWYETSITKIITLLILTLAIVSLFRWRNRKILQQANKLEVLVNQRTLELKQMSEKRSEFFANISHELRTPLTLILGPLDDVMTAESTLTRADVKLVHNSAQRMKRLVDQMLDLQKIDANKLELYRSSHNLIHFLISCIEPFKLLAKRLNIELNLKDLSLSESAIKIVSIDPLQLEKVLGNLLSNAFKFSPPNHKIVITVELASSKMVKINILDDGPGFQHGAEKRIFNRFSQELSGHKIAASQGTGIGLALVKEITELHGGKATAKNRSTGGACFTISLPFNNLQTDKLNAKSESESIEETQETSETESLSDIQNQDAALVLSDQAALDWNNDQVKILIVEDNTNLRYYIASHLQSQYQLIFAENGELGLKASRKHIPDVIITDVMMPNMNGFEMASALRNDPMTASIPFLFLTAKVAIEDELHGLSLGADDYMTKPFSSVLLKARIKAILNARERLKRSFKQYPILDNQVSIPSSLKERATVAILENLSDPDFGVTALADKLFMSRSKLHRQLKSQHKITASDLLRSIRMGHAKKLLHQRAGNVSEVCCAVGYTNLSSFSNIFYDTFGERPSTYN